MLLFCKPNLLSLNSGWPLSLKSMKSQEKRKKGSNGQGEVREFGKKEGSQEKSGNLRKKEESHEISTSCPDVKVVSQVQFDHLSFYQNAISRGYGKFSQVEVTEIKNGKSARP